MSFVPPPPPGVVVPPPPAAAAADAPAAAAAPKIVKPGGVALDMSDLFGSPKTGAKKALPPWERKRKTPTPPGTTSPPPPAAAAPSAAVVTPSNPLQCTLPAAVPLQARKPNAPVAVSCKSLPTAILTVVPGAVPPPPPSLPAAAMLPSDVPVVGGAAAAAPSVPATYPPTTATAAAVPPPPPPLAGLSAGPPAPLATTATAAAAAQRLGATAPVPGVPAQSVATAAPAVMPQATVGAPVAATSAPQAAPLLPVTNPAALAVSARIVEEILRDTRVHLATPSTAVVAPHVVFRGQEQRVAVMPLGPLPPRRSANTQHKKAGRAAAGVSTVSSNDEWCNRYGLQLSPSWPPAHHLGQPSPPPRTVARAQSGRGHTAGPYFQNVDVHRYIARRYFGGPPPVEH